MVRIRIITKEFQFEDMGKLQETICFLCFLLMMEGNISVYAQEKPVTLSTDEVIADFEDYIESIPFYSSAQIKRESRVVNEHITNLQNWKDKESYTRQNQLNTYIHSVCDSVTLYRNQITSLVIGFLDRYDKNSVADKEVCINRMQNLLEKKLNAHEQNINLLDDEIEKAVIFGVPVPNILISNWKYIGVCAGLLVLFLLLTLWYIKVRKKDKKKASYGYSSVSVGDASSNIVVRRRTTSILKKQSLDDVIGNENYLEINCSEFCDHSAVRRIYLKNTCIKEIYNMYAEDLRNPNNPKEDGCMVVGRWVHDNETNEYYVSLEQIVLPGDDAVFDEYELNFGGKIKLKVKDKLRKLRIETNLQYDLTCWVHSHPGLGVFFSSSDTNVQMQLKHPTHPHFLIAIVVDILTPQQELGIFTFKQDSSISSKSDLKRLYSLEELYQWAVESERNSFKAEDYFNMLTNSTSLSEDCYAIELSNGAIIDMGMMVTNQDNGLVGMAHGYTKKRGDKKLLIVEKVTKAESIPDNELTGCFVIATHCSIPSVRKLVAQFIGRISFVLVYTTADCLLTSIPVINHELCTDEHYYGEQKLEDLKIWTRRKR